MTRSRSIHPSIFYTAYPLQGSGDAGADLSWHWASGGVHPGQVASQSQCQNMETTTHIHIYGQFRVTI